MHWVHTSKSMSAQYNFNFLILLNNMTNYFEIFMFSVLNP
jgi:hypothetical protein